MSPVRPARKPAGRPFPLLRALGAALAVVLVLLIAAAAAVYVRLEQGPVSLQALVPWLKAPMEARVGRPVDVQGLQLALGEGGLVLSAGPIVIGGDAPARAERVVLRVGLPFQLQSAELDVADADARTLLAAWPDDLAQEAHAQVAAIVQGGTIRRGQLRYRFHEEGPDDISLDIDAQEPRVRLPNGLPDVAAPSAQISLAQGTLQVTAPSATAVGLSASSVDISIDHITDDAPSRLVLRSQIEGPAGRMYQLFTQPPLDFVPGDLVEIGSLRGTVSGNLHLGLPLQDEIPLDEVDLEADGRYRNLSGRLRLPMPIELDRGTGSFSVREGAIRVDGRARLSGSPVDVVVNDRWRGRGDPRRIELRGPVDARLLEHFGMVLPAGLFEGKAETALVLTQPRPPTWHAQLDADLKDATLREELLGLLKREGEPGRLTAEASATGRHEWSIERFAFEAGDQRASGHLHPEGESLSLRLDELVTSRMDLTGDLLLGPDSAVRGSIAAKRLKMPTDEERGAENEATDAAQEETQPPTPLDLTLYIDELQSEGDPLRGVKGQVKRDAQGFQEIELAFNLGGAGKLTLVPEGDIHRLDVIAPDAGGLLMALGAGDALIGGELKIAATVQRQVPSVLAEGRIDLANTAVRMSGDQRTPFRKIVIPFVIDGPMITITQARMTGSVIGLRLSGTLNRDTRALAMSGEATPLYPLNRFVGQIPIIGRILGGARGLGAINPEFTLGGTLDAPDARVAASSILLPGSIRDLLRAIEPR